MLLHISPSFFVAYKEYKKVSIPDLRGIDTFYYKEYL